MARIANERRQFFRIMLGIAIGLSVLWPIRLLIGPLIDPEESHHVLAVVLAPVLAPAAFIGYFLPTCIAFHREHQQKFAILALNFFAIVYGIPWVIALVWSLMKKSEH